MAQAGNLNELLESLFEKLSSGTSFIDGKLLKLDDHQLAFSSSNGINATERFSVLKQISSIIKLNIDLLTKAALYKSNRCRDFSNADLESMVHDFQYFSKWSKKVSNLADKKEFVARGRLTAFILDDNPIYLTLSWLTAASLTAGNSLNIFVNEKYLVPSICFAFLLDKAGVPAGVVNILPYVKEKFQHEVPTLCNISGIVPGNFSLSIDLGCSNFQNVLVKKYSPSPMLILKSADIDSATMCFLKITRDHESLWFPNIIYVEEAVYKQFSKTLEKIVEMTNCSTKEYETDSSVTDCLKEFINEKKGQGYEVITLHHRFSTCSIIFNHDNSTLPSNFRSGEETAHQHLVTVMPVRTAQEGISRINQTGSLGLSLWSDDAVEITSIPFELKCGTVWVNCAGYFDASVPVPLWWSQSFGSFSGKRTLFENLTYPETPTRKQNDGLYSNERNSMLPKRSVSDILQQSISAASSWSKTEIDERLNVLQNVVTLMEKNWNSHFKLILDQTPESVWKSAINYINFWSSFIGESLFEQKLTARNCHILCKSEPVGVIGILAGSVMLDTLVFLVAGALAYGNTVIVGLSSDTLSSVIGVEFERVFNPGLVSVVMDDSASLWRQFETNKNIASVWWVKDCLKSDVNMTVQNVRKVVGFSEIPDMTVMADIFETYVTKSKCVWLPYR